MREFESPRAYQCWASCVGRPSKLQTSPQPPYHPPTPIRYTGKRHNPTRRTDIGNRTNKPNPATPSLATSPSSGAWPTPFAAAWTPLNTNTSSSASSSSSTSPTPLRSAYERGAKPRWVKTRTRRTGTSTYRRKHLLGATRGPMAVSQEPRPANPHIGRDWSTTP